LTDILAELTVAHVTASYTLALVHSFNCVVIKLTVLHKQIALKYVTFIYLSIIHIYHQYY